MAGSAVNLTGMLSQINSSLGNMGNTVGQGMFNPMLEIQKEQRAEEQRKRLEAEKIAKQRGAMGDITHTNNVVQEALQNPHATGDKIAAARAALQEKAQKNPENANAYMAQDAKLAKQEVEIHKRGSLQQVYNLDKELARKDLNPEIREAYTNRRAELMEVPGVSSALAAQAKAQRAADLQKGELKIQEQKLKDIKTDESASELVQAILERGDLSLLDTKPPTVPTRVWEAVIERTGNWAKSKRETDELRDSNKDYSSRYKGTPFEETYQIFANGPGGFKAANERMPGIIADSLKRDTLATQAAENEFNKLTTQQQMESLLTSESQTKGWDRGWGADTDMQEAFAALDEDQQSEIVDYMTETYQAAMEAKKGQETAYKAAIAAGSTALGVKMPKSVQDNKPPVVDENFIRAMQAMEAKINALEGNR